MPDPDRWGVARGYVDATGTWRDVPDSTVEAVLAAIGAHDDGPPPHERAAGTGDPLRCFLPDDLRTWGWTVQLYATRSARSFGAGDLDDLRELAAWSASLGAGVLVVNPLHAHVPGLPQQPSPYYPSSRRFLDPLYLRVDELDGTAGVSASDRRIDRDEAYRAKLGALEQRWERFEGSAEAEAWYEAHQPALGTYATFCTLVEELGRQWRRWPAEYRRPDSPAVAALARELRGRVRFHQWVQWLLDRQLRSAAGAGVRLVQDLAVGVDPDGADAWADQAVYASGMSVGAPPDVFNPEGQNWGLVPWDPWKLRAAGYEPFADVLRAALGPGGGVRIDHVMGLFRLWWVPEGCGPAEGTYVRYPAGELLDIVARESQRAQAFVVGEDLGTVEDAVRDELAARQVLSTRLLWFEDVAPSAWPALALGATTTHDLPTVPGVWTGADHQAGEFRSRVAAASEVDKAVVETYRQLAEAPCAVLTATLEDALGVVDRPNHPGTIDPANWSVALPLPLEEIVTDPRCRRLAEVLQRR